MYNFLLRNYEFLGGGIMAIRCASKAIIVEKDLVLLNRCKRADGTIYYDLPGGGQKIYESLEEAVIREVKEETGYDVRVDKFVAMAEEIYTSDYLRERYPEYTHRILHIFKADIVGNSKDQPTETDFEMEECVWMPLSSMESIETCPSGLYELLVNYVKGNVPVYMGTEYITRH